MEPWSKDLHRRYQWGFQIIYEHWIVLWALICLFVHIILVDNAAVYLYHLDVVWPVFKISSVETFSLFYILNNSCQIISIISSLSEQYFVLLSKGTGWNLKCMIGRFFQLFAFKFFLWDFWNSWIVLARYSVVVFFRLIYTCFSCGFYLVRSSNRGKDDGTQKEPCLCWPRQSHFFCTKEAQGWYVHILQGFL